MSICTSSSCQLYSSGREYPRSEVVNTNKVAFKKLEATIPVLSELASQLVGSLFQIPTVSQHLVTHQQERSRIYHIMSLYFYDYIHAIFNSRYFNLYATDETGKKRPKKCLFS